MGFEPTTPTLARLRIPNSERRESAISGGSHLVAKRSSISRKRV